MVRTVIFHPYCILLDIVYTAIHTVKQSVCNIILVSSTLHHQNQFGVTVTVRLSVQTSAKVNEINS